MKVSAKSTVSAGKKTSRLHDAQHAVIDYRR